MAELSPHTQNVIQKQQRQRSDCASSPSDLSLGCSLPKLLNKLVNQNQHSVMTQTYTTHKLYPKCTWQNSTSIAIYK